MRQLILGSLAAGILGLLIGCGSKHAEAPSTDAASDTTAEPQKVAGVKASAPIKEKMATPRMEARIEATWDSKLKYYTEPANAAKTSTPPSANCAVAGRVRLFVAEKEKPQEAEGMLTVMLFNCTPQPGIDEPLLIYEWRIEGESLKHFRAENVADPEYTFVLPWDTYKKDITKVRIDVKYEPKMGTALNAKGDVLTLDPSEMKEPTKN